jgi:hypothetical protein
MIWSQAAILLLGVLHAFAAYAYFSRKGPALLWALGWLALAAAAAWALPVAPMASAACFALAVLGWTAWWTSLRALPRRQWIAENAHQATGSKNQRMVTLHHVRNFEWRSPKDFDERWEDARIDLDALLAVDLFVCTWGDPRIAHLIVSFVVRDGAPVAFSIETRRELDESWTALAGFMKAFELIVIAARERDVIRLRTTIRRETVRRYRLITTPEMRARLLLQYLREMNSLARHPRYYNTLFANCTTEVARIVRAAGRSLPWAWPLVASGLVPRYFHSRGLIDPSRPFEAIEAEADIGERARDETTGVEFSARIRAEGRADMGAEKMPR